jgi:hypothetical protein
VPEVRIDKIGKEAFGVCVECRGRIGPAMQRRAEFVRTLRNRRAPFALSQRLLDGDLRQIGHHVIRLMRREFV